MHSSAFHAQQRLPCTAAPSMHISQVSNPPSPYSPPLPLRFRCFCSLKTDEVRGYVLYVSSTQIVCFEHGIERDFHSVVVSRHQMNSIDPHRPCDRFPHRPVIIPSRRCELIAASRRRAHRSPCRKGS